MLVAHASYDSPPPPRDWNKQESKIVHNCNIEINNKTHKNVYEKANQYCFDVNVTSVKLSLYDYLGKRKQKQMFCADNKTHLIIQLINKYILSQ